MTCQRFVLHPVNPQRRLLRQAAERLRAGELLALPTDAAYILCCALGERQPVDRMRALRGIDDRHLLTLICRDLSELAQYATVSNVQFRFLKEWTPGAYTFILPATREVPRRLWHPSRKTVGLRVPDSALVQALLEEYGEPVIATTLIAPGDDLPLSDPDEIFERFGKRIDLLLEGPSGGIEPTTVIDLTGAEPEIIRVGKGDVSRMSA